MTRPAQHVSGAAVAVAPDATSRTSTGTPRRAAPDRAPEKYPRATRSHASHPTPSRHELSLSAPDWRSFALLLIDVQRDFWSESVAATFPEFPDNVARLLSFCRATGIDVVHLRARFRPDGSDWMVNARLRGRIPCVEGTPGADTLDFARELPGEAVFVKQTWDGFEHPALSAHLRENGKRFLLVAGLVTSVCVLFTAASAAQRGFLTAVIEDCCADRPEAHAETLKRYGGLVFRRTSVNGVLDVHESRWEAFCRLDELQATAAAPPAARGDGA
jgi:nicotinamidase-related amidase